MLNLKSLEQHEITDEQYEKLKGLIHKKVGMVFGQRLETWVKKQVTQVFVKSKDDDLDKFVDKLVANRDQGCAQETFESLAVHETMFYRDKKYFAFMREIVFPTILEQNKGTKEINLWIAAGSSGQEAYSILFTLCEHFPEIFDRWKINFYSTDLSNKIIEKASAGIYEVHEMNRGMEDDLKRRKYFEQIDSKSWQVKREYRRMLTFKQGNLVEDFHGLPRFDFISCRNVLIYFSDDVKSDIIHRLGKKTKDGGFLLLGQVDLINGTVPEGCKQKIHNLFPYLVKNENTD